MIKIVTTGPESSGKSTLAKALAEHYQVHWVPEYSRDYIDKLNRSYREEDLLEMAKGQIKREDEAASDEPDLLICDTSLIVLKIWSEYRYGRCHPWILEQSKHRLVNLYLLCTPDIPWEPDPQRENPTNRDELFLLYQQALVDEPAVTIQGNYQQRLTQAINSIDQLLP